MIHRWMDKWNWRTVCSGGRWGYSTWTGEVLGDITVCPWPRHWPQSLWSTLRMGHVFPHTLCSELKSVLLLHDQLLEEFPPHFKCVTVTFNARQHGHVSRGMSQPFGLSWAGFPHRGQTQAKWTQPPRQDSAGIWSDCTKHAQTSAGILHRLSASQECDSAVWRHRGGCGGGG